MPTTPHTANAPTPEEDLEIQCYIIDLYNLKWGREETISEIADEFGIERSTAASRVAMEDLNWECHPDDRNIAITAEKRALIKSLWLEGTNRGDAVNRLAAQYRILPRVASVVVEAAGYSWDNTNVYTFIEDCNENYISHDETVIGLSARFTWLCEDANTVVADISLELGLDWQNMR